MLSPYIIILIIIIVICLYVSEKYDNPPSTSVPGTPGNLKVSNIQNNSITLAWDLPTTPVNDKIKGYMLMLRKLSDKEEAFYLKVYENSTCISCKYVFNNIELDSNTDYVVGVMGFNNSGTGAPAFKTFHSSETSLTTNPSLTPTSSNRLFENTSTNGMDIDLNNLISRADGIYEIGDSLKYPDTYENDIKQSLKTLNDQVKKDLQEYRINVHLAATK
jgi:hypothetical protein